MKELGYYEKNFNKCLVTEEIQPKCMLFKTNYRSIGEAKVYIKKLEDSLKKYL